MTAGVLEPCLHFGSYTLDLANRRLCEGEREIELGNRYFDALALLASHPGELIAKDRFMAEVWAGIPVTDEALTQCVRTLRRALGDSASAPQFIQTVPKHGYRFIAETAARPHENAPALTRVRRDAVAGRLAGATTIGGGISGLVGGLAYGLAGTSGSAGPIVAITLLTVALSIVGASAIGAGLGAAHILRPGHVPTSLAGAVLGGLTVGAVGQMVATAGLSAITGVSAAGTTGMIEGAGLGLACACGLALAERFGRTPAAAVAIGAAAGAAIMALFGLAGARSYADTLAMLEGEFPASAMRIAPLLSSAGRIAALGMEGAVFVASIVAANRLARRRDFL